MNHATNISEVWKRVNRIRGKHVLPPAHPDPAGKASAVMREYKQRSATASLPPDMKDIKETMDPVRQATVDAAVLQADDTDQPITRDELLRAQKTSGDTAPGDDGITYSMLNVVCHVEGDPLLRLFNMSLTQGVLPEGWTKANIIPIPKQNEDKECDMR